MSCVILKDETKKPSKSQNSDCLTFPSNNIMSSVSSSLYGFVSGRSNQLDVCFSKTFVLLSVYIITLKE